MFKPIVHKAGHRVITKRGRPFTRFVCGVCERGCRTEQGLKAHITRMHKGEGLEGAGMSGKGHSKPPSSLSKTTKQVVATDGLQAVRLRIAENIERLQRELADVDKAIEVCERHLGGE
jgi:hypothetical protein